jgi:phosphotransferase system  glucose/maltose/N-acetylglucosamine-specific IIC component
MKRVLLVCALASPLLVLSGCGLMSQNEDGRTPLGAGLDYLLGAAKTAPPAVTVTGGVNYMELIPWAVGALVGAGGAVYGANQRGRRKQVEKTNGS